MLESPSLGHFPLSIYDVEGVSMVSAASLSKALQDPTGVGKFLLGLNRRSVTSLTAMAFSLCEMPSAPAADIGVQVLGNMSFGKEKLTPLNHWWAALEGLPNGDLLNAVSRHRHALEGDGRVPDALIIRLGKNGPVSW